MGLVAWIQEIRNAYEVFVRKPVRKSVLRSSVQRQVGDMKICIKKSCGRCLLCLSSSRWEWVICFSDYGSQPSGSIKAGNPSILLALQPWVSLGLLDNQSPLLSILRLLCPLSYLHYPQICYNIIHPSRTRSSFPSSYKQSSFHHPSWHCPNFHSLYMAQPSYPLRFYEFHNIFSLYKSI